MHFFLHLTGFNSFSMNSVLSDNTQEGDSSVAIAVTYPGVRQLLPPSDSPPQPSREHGQTARHASPDIQQEPNTSSCIRHSVLGRYHISVWVAKKAASCHSPDLADRFCCCGQWNNSCCCWELPSPSLQQPDLLVMGDK